MMIRNFTLDANVYATIRLRHPWDPLVRRERVGVEPNHRDHPAPPSATAFDHSARKVHKLTLNSSDVTK